MVVHIGESVKRIVLVALLAVVSLVLARKPSERLLRAARGIHG